MCGSDTPFDFAQGRLCPDVFDFDFGVVAVLASGSMSLATRVNGKKSQVKKKVKRAKPGEQECPTPHPLNPLLHLWHHV